MVETTLGKRPRDLLTPSTKTAAVLLVLAGVAAATTTGCASDGDVTVSAAPSVAAPPTTARPTAAEITDAVRVVDSGFTNGHVMGCNTAGGQATGFYPSSCSGGRREPIRDSLLYGSVSYGFVIENTSDQVILRLPVTYRFVDSQGAVITEHATAFSDDDSTGETRTIPVLRAGERVGVGGMKYPGRPDVAGIQVEIGEPGNWMPQAHWDATPDGVADRGELTVTDVDVRPGERNEPVTTFTVESSYENPVDPLIVFVIFYDAAGQIIGGADGSGVDSIPARGSAHGEVPLDDPIEVPGIDAARTEVYVFGLRVTRR